MFLLEFRINKDILIEKISKQYIKINLRLKYKCVLPITFANGRKNAKCLSNVLRRAHYSFILMLPPPPCDKTKQILPYSVC